MKPSKVLSPCLQILGTYRKVKSKNSDLFYNVKLQEQTIHILHDSNKEYRKKYKTTFIKQAKEILDIPNPISIAYTIKKNIELQTEEICFDRS